MMRKWHAPARGLGLVLVIVLVGGCAGGYFRQATEVPPGVRYALSEWPFREYWTGLIFNGAKIGYTHLEMERSKDHQNRFDIRSEAVMRFHFLALDKEANLASFDQVAEDLTLRRFAYDYDLDGNRLTLRGRIREGVLDVEITTARQGMRQRFSVNGGIYPASAIVLYPVLHGLEPGRRYQYRVYSGETRKVATVIQEVLGWEESKLFPGPACKIRTSLEGQEVITWIDPLGRPQLERSLGGVIISGLEPEERAKKYLTLGVLNKQDTLLDFSLIRTEAPIMEPRQAALMTIVLEGIPDDFPMPGGELQACNRDAGVTTCVVRVAPKTPRSIGTAPPADAHRYLQPSVAVPSRHAMIRRAAKAISGEPLDANRSIRETVDWIRENIQRVPVDVFSALDVLETGKAECQGHTYLYAALARSLNIPTKVVSGIVYSGEHDGFLYHTWAESLVEGVWVPVDPTFGQVPVDATHLKLVEGEELAELAPLVQLVGRLKAREVQVRH